MSGTVVLSLVMATVGNVNVTIGFGNTQCTKSVIQPVGSCFTLGAGNSFKITKGCHDQNGFQRVTIQEFDGTTCERKRGGLRQVDADQCAQLGGSGLIGFQCNSRRFPPFGNKVLWSVVTNSPDQCKSVDGSVTIDSTDSAGRCACLSWSADPPLYGQCYKFLSCNSESQTITRVAYDLSDDQCTTPIETRTFNVNTCMKDPGFNNPARSPGLSYSSVSCIELVTPSPATDVPDTPMPETPEAGGSLGPFFTLLATAAVMFIGL